MSSNKHLVLYIVFLNFLDILYLFIKHDSKRHINYAIVFQLTAPMGSMTSHPF